MKVRKALLAVFLTTTVTFSLSACAADVNETNSGNAEAVPIEAPVAEQVAVPVLESREEPNEMPIEVPLAELVEVFRLTDTRQKEISPSYLEIIDNLSADEAYAIISTVKEDVTVLLVTDGTFPGANAENAAAFCEVWLEKDGMAEKLGQIAAAGGMGSGYPIKYDAYGIYAAMHHDIARYIIDFDSHELITAEFADETFTADGEATYTYSLGEQTLEVPGYSQMKMLFERYDEAREVAFVINNE